MSDVVIAALIAGVFATFNTMITVITTRTMRRTDVAILRDMAKEEEERGDDD